MDKQIISPHFSLRKSLPSFNTIATFIVIAFLIWAFFSKQTFKFYASFLFLFYNFTHSMWISVIMLGVFQTLILIPFRIINLTKSKHIRDFETKVNELKESQEQSFLIKKNARGGNRVFLYYLIDFFVQLTSYVSIGRLFLTDFYSTKISPLLLYSFVPYPDYPLQDRWFKIPYLKVIGTHDFGIKAVIISWIVVLLISSMLALFLRYMKNQKKFDLNTASSKIKDLVGFVTGSSVILMIAMYFLLRHFPQQISLAIFTGDISKPNPSFNTITAFATFITIIWLDTPTILKKSQLAKAAGIEAHIIHRTEIQLFSETLRSATVVGLGAYFITNVIPCAFELSIFTLEIISWLSPLTLDRIILRGNPKYEAPITLDVTDDPKI